MGVFKGKHLVVQPIENLKEYRFSGYIIAVAICAGSLIGKITVSKTVVSRSLRDRRAIPPGIYILKEYRNYLM